MKATDEAGNRANVHDGIAYGESYFISIRINEKRWMIQVTG